LRHASILVLRLSLNTMKFSLLPFATLAISSVSLHAQETNLLASQEPPTTPPGFLQLDPMVVIGSNEALYKLPGSGVVIDAEEFRAQNHSNVNRILSKVPGVYVREEDGYGNFPNISIRGGDGTRNEKVTVMEDGILMAPAPYSAPGAYYSPRSGRMSGIEVLKGSSQVRFGPHTTGGVLNFLSTPIPDQSSFYSRNTYGTDNEVKSHTHYGDIVEGDFGRFGYLGEIFLHSADGYREIEAGAGYSGSNDTGFTAIEPMVKFFYEPNTAMYQRLEFKYGYTDLDADETYVGLTESDLADHPHRRYAGTRFDRIETQQHRSSLKWLAQPTDALTTDLTGYYNEFSRNWYKIRKAGGESIHEVLANPSDNRAAFDNLRLRGQGTLGIRANARDYEAWGVQASANYETNILGFDNQLHFGVRYHEDKIRRFQRDDAIQLGSDGRVLRIDRGEDGSGGNRYQQTAATALWLENRIEFGQLAIKPGIRYENLDFNNTDYESNSSNTVTASRSGQLDFFVPGIGFTYEWAPDHQFFGGVYRGVSTPGPRAHLKDGVQIEESTGFELGHRGRSESGLSTELALFYTDFDNLIGSDTGFGDSSATNAGEARVYGVEAAMQYDFNQGGAITVPVNLSFTYTNAELTSALSSGGADDIFAGGRDGASIPYIPEIKLSAGIGLQAEAWGIGLDATYVSESFGTAANLDRPRSSSRQGRIGDSLVFDLAAHYQVTDCLTLLAGVQNLFDDTSIVSRLPEGPRAGAPRTAYVGFEIQF